MTALDFLVTGAAGQLGRAVVTKAAERGLQAFGVDLAEMPLESRAAIVATVLTRRPRFIIHCGAMTNVDGCEQDPLTAQRINGLATGWVTEAAEKVDAGVLYVSTDFVFDGQQQGMPYTEDAAVNPLSVYGRSKRLGEEAVLAHERPNFYVVRTSWVYGPGGRNFPRAILDRARSGQPLKVVTDQIGRPTMTLDLAEAMLDLAGSGAPGGVYHAANEGHCSWHGFAREVLQACGQGEVAVGEQLASELALPAARPAWSVLDTGRLAAVRGKPMPHHRDAIARFLAEESRLAEAAEDRSATPSPDGDGVSRTKDYT